MNIRSCRFTLTSLSCALFLIAPVLGAQEAAGEKTALVIDEQLVERVAGKAFELLEQEFGLELGEGLECRIAEEAEIAEVLLRHWLPRYQIWYGDEARAEAEARAFTAILASRSLGEYSPTAGAVLVCAENFADLERNLNDPSIRSEPTLRALILHLGVRAADAGRHGWPERGRKLDTPESMRVLDAVSEGHAQFLVSQVAASDPRLSKGLETLTRSYARTTGKGDAEKRYLERLAAGYSAFVRIDGGSFMAHLSREGGPDSITSAFRSPPEDVEILLHPEWFIKPEGRIATGYQLESALNIVRKRFESEDWTARDFVLTQEDIQNVFHTLGEEIQKRILEAHVQNRVIIVGEHGPGSVIAALYEFSSPREASHFVARSEHLMRIKDELMRQGDVAILSSEYSDAFGPTWQGVTSRKLVAVTGGNLLSRILFAARGRVAVEAHFNSVDQSDDEIYEIVTEMLSKVLETRPEVEAKAAGADAR